METILKQTLDTTFDALGEIRESRGAEVATEETGRVVYVGGGIIHVDGLPGVQSYELVSFRGGETGIAFNLDPDQTGVVLLDTPENLKTGQRVRRTGRVLQVPVGEAVLGRTVDPLGRPRDGKRAIETESFSNVEQDAPHLMERAPVSRPLQTGLKAVDALIPVGHGQRELIVGDRQTGKTAVAVDTMINQQDTDVINIYCAIGQKASDVARVIATLKDNDVMKRSVVVAAIGDDPPGLQYIAPYSGTAMGEYFMKRGRKVLIVYDDLSKHAVAYRELSLLLRRPPAREAYPGDIFYIHSRLLERSTHYNEENGGGSLTALPIVETQAQNISAYIPTNLISITDGQIYLSPELFKKGVLPAVDVGRSVSRVGGKTQLPAFRSVAGDLRLAYSQFEEVEKFARYSTRLDEDTRATLERGRRVREVLKQPQYAPLPVEDQIIILLAVVSGHMDDVPVNEISDMEKRLREHLHDADPSVVKRIRGGEKLNEDDRKALIMVIRSALSAKDEEEPEEQEAGEAEKKETERTRS